MWPQANYTSSHDAHPQERGEEKWENSHPLRAPLSWLFSLSSWLTYPSLSCPVCGRNYSCPSFRLSLNNGTPQRPRSRYDSLSKFDFSSHLRSINSAICWILCLNGSSRRQSAYALGKVEILCWKNCAGEWRVKLTVMRERKTLQTKRREESETSQQHPLFVFFYCCLFYFGTEETVEWRKWKVSSVIVAFALSQYHQIEQFYFPRLSFPSCLSGVGGLFYFSLLPVCPRSFHFSFS